MIGTKFYKKNFDAQAYAEAAEWCNDSQAATIKDMGEYYEVVEIVIPLSEIK